MNTDTVTKDKATRVGETAVDAGRLTHNELHLIMFAIAYADDFLTRALASDGTPTDDDENSLWEAIQSYGSARSLIGDKGFDRFIQKVADVHRKAAVID